MNSHHSRDHLHLLTAAAVVISAKTGALPAMSNCEGVALYMFRKRVVRSWLWQQLALSLSFCLSHAISSSAGQ